MLTDDLAGLLLALVEQRLRAVGQDRLDVSATLIIVHFLYDEMIKNELLLAGLNDALCTYDKRTTR